MSSDLSVAGRGEPAPPGLSSYTLFGFGILAVVTGTVFLGCSTGNPKVTVGKDEVYYTGSATRLEAQNVGLALHTMHFFKDLGASVILSKDGNGTAISFVVKDGTWDSASSVESFEEMGRELAPKVGGLPLKVRLTNATRDIKREMSVGKVVVGTKDEIYYFGTATETDAKALGAALQTSGFFTDKAFSVFLEKGMGTILAFVVRDGFWDDPEHVALFEHMTREVAGTVGGLPITFRLLNSGLETKKEVTVR
jgi:hypothetical protein